MKYDGHFFCCLSIKESTGGGAFYAKAAAGRMLWKM